MPVLAQEPDCFPGDLLASAVLPSRFAGGRWWLAYTRSRREKDFVRRLGASGVAHYCPTIQRRHRSTSGRVRESFVPLFSGYVFLLGSEEDRVAALTTNCVSSLVAVADQVRLTNELRALRQLLSSGVPVTPESKIEAGTRVRVVSGPLQGQEGFVIQRLGKRRLLVTVRMLQQGASADLDECDVETI